MVVSASKGWLFRLPMCSLYENVWGVQTAGRIEWATKAVKDMRRLAAPDQARIIAKVEQYATAPASLANNVIQLTGSTYRRLRVGDYRILFHVETTTIVVLVVLRVRHRSDAYD